MSIFEWISLFLAVGFDGEIFRIRDDEIEKFNAVLSLAPSGAITAPHYRCAVRSQVFTLVNWAAINADLKAYEAIHGPMVTDPHISLEDEYFDPPEDCGFFGYAGMTED